jgi:hypothetical protein
MSIIRSVHRLLNRLIRFVVCAGTVLGTAVAFAAAPTAYDVYAGAAKSTATSAQSVRVDLEAVANPIDPFDPFLLYRVVSAPAHGSLSDPNNGDAAVTTGAIASSWLTYHPNVDFTGIDSFTYTASVGVDESEAKTVWITVGGRKKQIGSDVIGDQFHRLGTDVAVSGDGLIVAVSSDRFLTSPTAPPQSFARVHRFSGNAWEQLGEDFQTALSVSLSGDGLTLAIGAFDITRVYQYIGDAWTQLGGNIASPSSIPCTSRAMLSSDGSTAAVRNCPGIQVFQYLVDAWVPLGGPFANDEVVPPFGLAYSGDGLTVAASWHRFQTPPDFPESQRDVAKVYRFQDGSWTQLGNDILNVGVDSQSTFGTGLSLSADGRTLAIGNPRDGFYDTDEENGCISVFTYSSGAWTAGLFQRQYTYIPPVPHRVYFPDLHEKECGSMESQPSLQDRLVWNDLGSSVSLSSDGGLLAVGGRMPSRLVGDLITTDPSKDSGGARLYKRDGDRWRRLWPNLDDSIGTQEVALSADGRTLAIGDPIFSLPGLPGSEAGRFRVYDVSEYGLELDMLFIGGFESGGTGARSAMVGD